MLSEKGQESWRFERKPSLPASTLKGGATVRTSDRGRRSRRVLLKLAILAQRQIFLTLFRGRNCSKLEDVVGCTSVANKFVAPKETTRDYIV